MFISIEEKVSILSRLNVLEKAMAQLLMTDKTETKRSTSGWSDETRKKQGERMKQYWADKKAKAAQ